MKIIKPRKLHLKKTIDVEPVEVKENTYQNKPRFNKKEEISLREQALTRYVFLFVCTAHALRAKKNQPRGSYVLKISPSSAPPGVRTLDTLIKRDLVIQNKVNFP